MTLDPFLPEERSPLLTNALASSLWELNSQRNHYAPPVATMARIFSEVFTKPSYVQEDFLDHTYGTVSLASRAALHKFILFQMYTAESKRKITQDPAVSLGIDGQLFLASEDRNEPREWANVPDPCKLLNWAT
jgi:U3 small nucleolar RNA-associated protein 19